MTLDRDTIPKRHYAVTGPYIAGVPTVSCNATCGSWPCEVIQLYDENKHLREALGVVMSWIDNWSPDFTEDSEWPATDAIARAAIHPGAESRPPKDQDTARRERRITELRQKGTIF